jgi:hypothetical protein
MRYARRAGDLNLRDGWTGTVQAFAGHPREVETRVQKIVLLLIKNNCRRSAHAETRRAFDFLCNDTQACSPKGSINRLGMAA